MNIVIMTGRLATAPECRTTANEKVICYFRIAVDRPKKQNGKKETDFFNVIAWNGTGEAIAKWFEKGDTISILGRLANDTYENSDGTKHHDNRIVVREFYFNSGYRKKNAESESEEDLEAFDAILNDPNVSF